MKRANWVMCCWQLITTTECPPAIRLLVVLIVTFQFSGCGTVCRCKKFRVMRSHRPRLFREAFAASSARIRRASRGRSHPLSLDWTDRQKGRGSDVEDIFLGGISL
jgi:hypothetical protein